MLVPVRQIKVWLEFRREGSDRIFFITFPQDLNFITDNIINK